MKLRKIIQPKKIPIPYIVQKEQLLEGKTAFISGGSRGIGFSIAKNFIESGAKVIISGRNEKSLIDSVKQLGENASYIVVDMRNVQSIEDMVDEIYINIENSKDISILVNNAGSHNTNSFGSTTEKQFDEVMETNIRGTYFLSQFFSNKWIENDINGHILNISSASAIRPGWSPYEISKSAIESLTRGMADLLIDKGIVVNALAPGPVATEMLGFKNDNSIYFENNPSKRVATVDEIAQWATYLVSDLGNYVVGSSLYVTGGGGLV